MGPLRNSTITNWSHINRFIWSYDTLPCVITPNVRGPFYEHGSTLIPIWITSNIHCKIWYKIIFLIPKFEQWSLWRLGMDNFTAHWTCDYVSMMEFKCLFYHDVGEIWWPQPIRLLKMGHVTGQGSTTTTWVGRVSDLGKSSFHKMRKKIR